MNKLLENKLIRLRATEPEDLEHLYKWENDTSLWEQGNANAPYSRFSLKQYLVESKQDLFADKQMRLMVVLKRSEVVIGMVDLYDFDPLHRRAGVGILIDEDYRKQGYALQVLKLLETYAFSFISLHQLYAFVPMNNDASMWLFRKAGYYAAATLNHWLLRGEKYEDVRVWQKIQNFKPPVY
ncbi:MAG: GNAT family N-acetyltransferase [Proteiniphilum sp.]|jgi:diamine N-acetyltransferase|nr:GNAT family N-acetyltransferase [Proteiniphilum sp.]MDD3955766.1 GNAT family N-acetyltransferase [Proteiniphilum sp.]MDD4451329.1 GNAT family N-acetyltransferase [Proteiniphilum sp.]NCB25570.1 N-acetyltransferase [Bacteroidia bacterium]